MAIRTTVSDVRSVITTDPAIDPYSFIVTASHLVDHVVSQDTDGVLTAAIQKDIETYIAAHLYALRDPQYRSKSTGSASASFQGQSGMRLDGTDWGQTAITLDLTGTLAALTEGGPQKVEMHWLGKPESERLSYDERN